jgi:SAM-dependent methyltransferase
MLTKEHLTKPAITTRDLLEFLRTKHIHAKFLDRLKLHYRPLICPYIPLLQRVRPEDRVGDIGCGSGQFLLLLSEFVKPSFSYGIEISQHLIDNGNELLSGLGRDQLLLETFDGSHFPPLIGTLDIIFLIDVVHHVPPAVQKAFLTNLAASMKSGARLVIKDINAGNPLVVFNKLHDLVVSREIGHELKPSNVAAILKEAGLEITDEEKCITYVYPHFTVAAKKP